MKTNKFWSPYIVGTGIGLLSTATIYFMNKTLGTSSTYIHVVGFIESLLVPKHVADSLYFKNFYFDKPIIDWQFALVIGLFFGGLISSKLYNSYQTESVPSIWQKNFGNSFKKRALGAFIGGVLLLFGARFAGGCTSGKAISVGLQLGISAWIFIATLFIGGIITAKIFYRK